MDQEKMDTETSGLICTADLRAQNSKEDMANYVLRTAGYAVAEALEKHGVHVSIEWAQVDTKDQPYLGRYLVTPKPSVFLNKE